MDGCPAIMRAVLLCLVRSKRYSSLKFCIWPVLLYSVIIEDYIYVRVLAGLNTGCNNNIIKTYFRGLELGLTSLPLPIIGSEYVFVILKLEMSLFSSCLRCMYIQLYMCGARFARRAVRETHMFFTIQNQEVEF